jgi:hypothetical protein
MNISKILIVGTVNNFCLETSYAQAATELQIQVSRFDPAREVQKHIRLGKIGRTLHNFWPVDIWTRKMNRELIVKARNERPDVIFLVGSSKIYYGTLTTIKLILPQCKLVWIWPDTPMNLNETILSCGQLFDLTATYSHSTLDIFSRLGFRNPQWIPLAGDLALHGNDVPQDENYSCDISFVGMWRPEREHFMKVINDRFSDLNIEVYGKYWQRDCKDQGLLKRWKGDGFYAKDLSNHFNRARININVIDDTNYPAANMRFFEVPTSGGLQLSSACPEMESDFLDFQHVLYFRDESELVKKIEWALAHPAETKAIRNAAHAKVREAHNYNYRIKSILTALK